MSIINDKVKEIEKFLDELEEFAPTSFEEYKNNLQKKRACERCFEIIIEALVDLAFLIIKEKAYKIPKEDTEAFFVLSKNNLISEELAKKLSDAKGMRNFIVHKYGKINDEPVYEAITSQLTADAEEFIKSIRKIK